MEARTLNKSIRFLSFDLDDTLWPVAPPLLNAELACYRVLQTLAPQILAGYTQDTLSALRIAFFKKHPVRHNLTLQRREWLQWLLRDSADAADIAEQALTAFLQQRSQVTPYDDVPKALQRLGQHYQLVGFTNGNADVRTTPLAAYFSYAFRSEDLGHKKPEPEAFWQMLARIDASADEVLHIGDNPYDDVYGARLVGMPYVWIRRHQQPWPEHVDNPCQPLDDLEHLCRHLKIDVH